MKDSAHAEIAGAVHKVLRGGEYVSPKLAEILVVDFDDDADRLAHERLSLKTNAELVRYAREHSRVD